MLEREEKRRKRERGRKEREGIFGEVFCTKPMHFQHCCHKIGASGRADARKEGRKREKGRKDKRGEANFLQGPVHFFSYAHFQLLNGWVCGDLIRINK